MFSSFSSSFFSSVFSVVLFLSYSDFLIYHARVSIILQVFRPVFSKYPGIDQVVISKVRPNIETGAIRSRSRILFQPCAEISDDGRLRFLG